jgi:hypothetical protein
MLGKRVIGISSEDGDGSSDPKEISPTPKNFNRCIPDITLVCLPPRSLFGARNRAFPSVPRLIAELVDVDHGKRAPLISLLENRDLRFI